MVTNKPEKFNGCKIVDGINIMKNKESYFEFTDQRSYNNAKFNCIY